MQRNNTTYLLHILQQARKIKKFVRNMDKAIFLTDDKTQYAVVCCIEIIGEATKRLSDDFRREHPSIPWKKIAGMRDRVIHRYDQVDLDVVWDVTQTETDNLITSIEPLIPPPEDEPDTNHNEET